MKLRLFTTIIVASALAACSKHDLEAGAPAAPVPPARGKRPNIVYIMSDDHAVQALSAYGHPISRLAPTPNIDRIARNGAVFENSFVTNSLCGPSRAAMLTGKFGHLNGFNQNGETFDGSQPTWPRALKQAGYQTAVVGKWHIGPTPKGLNFDFWKILDDQGEYFNPDIITSTGKARVEGYATDLITQYGLDWLRNGRDPDKPFLLMLHHKAPHRNWMPAPRHFLKYANIRFPVPESYFDDYNGRPAAAGQKMSIYRDMHEGHDLKMTTKVGSSELRYDPWKQAFGRLTPEQRRAWDSAYQAANDAVNAAKLSDRDLALWKYQRYMQQYLATVASVDDSVGAILDYLEKSGLTDNTVVVYTSDQGFFLGEHGWFDKRWIYEESLRTPLLIQYPGRIKPGSRVKALVQNIDYAPTFLEYAGLPVSRQMQGRSLVGLAAGKAVPDWRQSIYYHYYEYPASHAVRPHVGVRSDRYKLARFYGGLNAWEFFDLETDPAEMRNRIDDPAYRKQIATMCAELLRLRRQYGDTSPALAASDCPAAAGDGRAAAG